MTDGNLRDNLQRAEEQARMEDAARRIVAAAGFEDVGCRAAWSEDGALHLSSSPAAVVRMRQMHDSLLVQLQREFPGIKQIRFGVERV